MHSKSSSNFYLRSWCTSTPFDSKGASFSVHLRDLFMGETLERYIFFTDETKKLVLTCLRLETGSNIHYFWSFTMDSKSSSNFFLRPWCTSTKSYSERARYSVHLRDSFMGETLERNIFFTDETKKLVLTCLRLETGSNIHYFWSFTMYSKSSSNFFLRPWCTSTKFYSERARYCVHLSDSFMGEFFKNKQFFTDETKKWF